MVRIDVATCKPRPAYEASQPVIGENNKNTRYPRSHGDWRSLPDRPEGVLGNPVITCVTSVQASRILIFHFTFCGGREELYTEIRREQIC